MVQEAQLVEGESGLRPADPGWFVLNVAEAEWWRHDTFGATTGFEGEDEAHFADFGINLHVLQPGRPNCMYHEESVQEDFLVLQGECLLLVEGEERPLRAWDFVHCPPGTAHVFVGAGEGPCVLLMTGARKAGKTVRYPVEELALRPGAGVQTETTEPPEAYAPFERFHRARPDGPMPWRRPGNA